MVGRNTVLDIFTHQTFVLRGIINYNNINGYISITNRGYYMGFVKYD